MVVLLTPPLINSKGDICTSLKIEMQISIKPLDLDNKLFKWYHPGLFKMGLLLPSISGYKYTQESSYQHDWRGVFLVLLVVNRIDPTVISEHLPFQHVLNFLFDFCGKLFDITFKVSKTREVLVLGWSFFLQSLKQLDVAKNLVNLYNLTWIICWLYCVQDCTGEVDVWNKDVLFFKVFNKSGTTDISFQLLDYFF